MIIAVSAEGNGMDSRLDLRFGRAKAFIIVDTKTLKGEGLENAAAASAGGAGISAAQTVVDKNVEAVITGNVGPNASRVLNAAGVKVYRGKEISVKENVELFLQGALEQITAPGPARHGQRG